jgi:gliding motility-associated lipoprotein GldH
MTFSRIKYVLVILGFSLLWACYDHIYYDEVTALPGDGWAYDYPLSFSFGITDTSKIFDVLVHLRNEKNYSYSNLWIILQTTAPNGSLQRDTLELILADETGKWLGEGRRSINTMLLPYRQSITFPCLGTYRIEVNHAMRDSTIQHIHDLGILIQEKN